eukprot:1161030-Pelagomonas_calceolata.AAC.2
MHGASGKVAACACSCVSSMLLSASSVLSVMKSRARWAWHAGLETAKGRHMQYSSMRFALGVQRGNMCAGSPRHGSAQGQLLAFCLGGKKVEKAVVGALGRLQ